MEKLKKIFQAMGKVLVAYSGGVDSSLLLKVALMPSEERMFWRSPHSLPCTLKGSWPRQKKWLRALGVRHLLIESNELEIEGFSSNPPNRCYYCKRELFEKLVELARRGGDAFHRRGFNPG